MIYEVEESIAYLTLNRPEKRNALNDELIAALKEGLRRADQDESLRAVVIRGAGKDFCSGADLAALQKISESSYEENLEDARNLVELFLVIREVKVRGPAGRRALGAAEGRARV